ncbi:MAG: septation protein SepH [Pontimonas sp.]
MHTLTVVGVEGEALIVVSDSGERFQIPMTSPLIDAVKKATNAKPSSAKRVSPRDIQAHFRRGLSAQQVADLTGETVEYVALFEGPVVAEREFIVDQAQLITFGKASGERDGSGTFGHAISARLEELGASEPQWSAWKEESGWMVEVLFSENDVEHRALWSFDPRKHILTPLNDDATVLSQEQPIQGPLIPKLRPVTATEEHPEGDRFDTEIFEDMSLHETGPLLEPVPYGRNTGTIPAQSEDASNNTADLLEALRRRRGEREPAPEYEDDARNAHPSTGSIRIVSDDSPGASVHHLSFTPDDDEPLDEEVPDQPVPPKPSSRKDRPEMPSWDDIVFGTKSDDDPA